MKNFLDELEFCSNMQCCKICRLYYDEDDCLDCNEKVNSESEE